MYSILLEVIAQKEALQTDVKVWEFFVSSLLGGRILE
jgi:hypothetical protein